MTKHDMPRFAQLMAGLAQTFHTDISRFDLENYWRSLRIHPLEIVEQAITNYCCSPQGHQFIPKPGEIVAYIEGSSSSQAMQAWAKVSKAIKHIGRYSTVIFDDPIIHVVVYDMGGWINLCELKEKEISFRAREFEKRYINYLINKSHIYPKQLIGLTDATNSGLGFKNALPILIGNEARAFQVYQSGQDAAAHNQFYKPLTCTLLKQLEQPVVLNLKKPES